MGKNSELSRKERLIFASADIWGGGGQTVIAVLYLVFLTNILGVRPALAGTTLMVVKIWDALIDPVLGVLEDNTRTRWGRRRPYLVLGGAALLMAMALLWLPLRFDSGWAQAGFIAVTNIFYATVASTITIAYSSMSTELTTDFTLCNKVNVTRLIFSMCSTAVCSLLPTIFFTMLTDGRISVSVFYAIVVGGFGVVFAVPIIAAGILCRERVGYSEEKTKLKWSSLAAPLRLRAFRQMVALYLTQTVTLDTVSAVIIYYGLYVVTGISSTVFLGIFLAVQIIMLPVFNKLMNTVSKTELFRKGLPLAILGAAGVALYPANWPAAGVYVITALMALGFAGAMTLSWIIYPDIVDIGELIEGERSAGSFSATMSFIRQVSSAVTIFIVGNVLDWSGFITPSEGQAVTAQPAATVWAIRLIILLVFAIIGGNGWRVARKMKLSPEGSSRIKYFLSLIHEGKGLSADEQDECDALIKLYK